PDRNLEIDGAACLNRRDKMRLLQLGAAGELVLTKDITRDIPPYAVLSHTWGSDDDEVKLQDLYIASRVGSEAN
ncbi:hypothetical protein JX266_014506, partial [Neoarthrinium moseri]